MDEVERIIPGFVEECRDDYVGLWEIVNELDRNLPNHLADREIQKLTLTVVRRLLEEGVRAGDLTEEGFIPWEASPEEIIARIDNEWKQLGVRSPNPFQIVALVFWP